MALRFQNDPHTKGQPPSYYANNKLYKDSSARTYWQGRTSRRVHDGYMLATNYGLDTVSDDRNSSPYSSPYYTNGRYNSANLVTQRGNSASVQGTKYLTSYKDDTTSQDFDLSDIQTSIELWQGKQIKFSIPYSGKVVGNTIAIKNTGSCSGILSVYFSVHPNSLPIYETAIDLCKVSADRFQKITTRSMTVFPATANAEQKIYVRMEIWDEIDETRSDNPFNTGRKIEIGAVGLDGHDAATVTLGGKNLPATNEIYNYSRFPSRPLIGLITNQYSCIPVDRVGDQKTGATVSDSGYRYDIFCIKSESQANLIIYDKEMRKIVDAPGIMVDGRAEYVQIAQVVDTSYNNWVYYVDGYSPLQRFKIGEWVSEEVTNSDVGEDTKPVLGASLILFHNNRLYIGGFLNDKNLFQCSVIDENGADYTRFPYRFYSPNNSPYALSTNTPVAMVEYESDTIMIVGKNFYSLFTTNVALEGDGGGVPSQVSSYTDSVGVQSAGDIVNYKGTLYSFDQKEGVRRYNGAKWVVIPNDVQSHFDRVDLTRPRKLWGFSNKLYFNYFDSVDSKPKCLIWDQQMNYQQYPWFQDVNIPFCDVRYTDGEELIGIHPDYPCIMELYAEDVWRRLDTPIVFERHTKYLTVPGNGQDTIVKRIHNEVLASSNRWWYIGISTDKQALAQYRGKDTWYRLPAWATEQIEDPVEAPFNQQDIYEKDSIIRLNINNLRVQCTSIQVKIMAKSFRDQCSLISTSLEIQARSFN